MIAWAQRARHAGPFYLAAGALMALAFPLGPSLPGGISAGIWPCGWVCLAPLMAASVRRGTLRGAAFGGLASGFAAFVPIMAWMPAFLARFGMLAPPEAAGVFVLLAFYLAVYPALFAMILRALSARWGEVAALTVAPAAWVALELARGTLLTGFPWCLLGYSQARVPVLIQVADLGGVYAVSFLLACTGAAAAILWTARRGGRDDRAPAARGALRRAAWLSLIPAAGLAYGAIRLGLPQGDGPDAAVRVALVQANVAQTDKWDPAERDRIEADHVRMTWEAVEAGARLVVWSESSVPASITTDPAYAARLEELARRTGADLVIGTVAYEARGGRRVPFNSALLIGPEGPRGERYDKQQLVPFGEYVPLSGMLFFLESLVQEAGDFQAGAGGEPLRGPGVTLGPLICYEAIFPELTRRWVRQGATALVNLTNDAWYGDTGMPRQHLSMSILRAVESRRWLVRCANTGISALVDPAGHLRERTRLDEEALLVGEIRPRRGTTVYAAIGDAFAIACAILTAVLLAIVIIRPARIGAPGGPAQGDSMTRPRGDRRPTQPHAS